MLITITIHHFIVPLKNRRRTIRNSVPLGLDSIMGNNHAIIILNVGVQTPCGRGGENGKSERRKWAMWRRFNLSLGLDLSIGLVPLGSGTFAFSPFWRGFHAFLALNWIHFCHLPVPSWQNMTHVRSAYSNKTTGNGWGMHDALLCIIRRLEETGWRRVHKYKRIFFTYLNSLSLKLTLRKLNFHALSLCMCDAFVPVSIFSWLETWNLFIWGFSSIFFRNIKKK